MDAPPTAPQEFFDRLQQEVDAAEEGSICKLELKFDPAGAAVNVPTLNPLRRDEPVYEQLVEHLKREGCSPGKYRIRLRVGGVIGCQKVEPVQFSPTAAPQVAPQVTARGAQVAPAGSSGDANPFAAVAKTLKDFRAAQQQLAEMFPEPEEEPEEFEEDEEEEDDQSPDDEAPPHWLDEAKRDAAKEIVPLAVGLSKALIEVLGAFAKKLGGEVPPVASTLGGAEQQPLRSVPAPQPVELVPDDDDSEGRAAP